VAKTFQNVTIGMGAFSINAREIGITGGTGTTVARGVETKDLEDGIPLQVLGRVPIREGHTLTIPMLELTIENLAEVSLNVPRTIIAGSAVTVLDAANETRTFAPLFGTGGLEYIRIPGVITTSGFTVENLAESVTYVAGTDYIYDAANGMIITIPGGAISEGETVRWYGTYTPPASERLQFGNNLPIQVKEVMFVHVSPVSGNIFTCFMPSAQFSGTLEVNFAKEEFALMNAQASAIPDPSYPSHPLGYWDIELYAA
jgi:hypothetical protein